MRHIINRLVSDARIFGVAVLTLAVGMAIALPPGSASAIVCHVFTAETDFYEGGALATETYYVPGAAVSGCKDINVRHIQNDSVAGDHCATFRVQMFPTSGGDYYTAPKYACSTNPPGPADGPVIPIATNVLNGTKYRIWYNVENLGQRHNFQIVD